jgi:hypothetical protein
MTDAREITVEEIERIDRHCDLSIQHGWYAHWPAKEIKNLCALARRALSQAGGLTADEMMGVGKYDPEPYPPS